VPRLAHNEGVTTFKEYVGWGIVIYAVVFLAWSGLIVQGLTEGIAPRLITLAALVAVTAIAGTSLRVRSWQDVVPRSLVWLVVAALADAIFTVPFAGWTIYADWNVWFGYALILAVPPLAALLATGKSRGI